MATVNSNSKPRMCNISTTLSCMLRCKMCYHWQHDERNIRRPTVDEWKKFIYSLKGEVASDFQLVFGGGEPLLFPEELIELISFASGIGFSTVLSTSAHTVDERYAERLVKAGLKDIGVTIFSLNPEVHDYVRG
ncbi:radical SAM protein, partial [Candidatus Omnitrophota bacterium]